MRNETVSAEPVTNQDTVREVVTSRWGVRVVVASLMALGVLSATETAIAQPLLIPYGIGACSPDGDDWNPRRHRDIGFIFGGNEHNPVLTVGRALTITDIKTGIMVVNRFQQAGERADYWTTLTHGGAADVFGRPPVIFKDGEYYFAQLWETDDPRGVKPGDNSIAVLPFAGCEPLQ